MPGQPGPAKGRSGRKLVPGIHIFETDALRKTWMAGISPVMTVTKVPRRIKSA